jgi:hypothetical protein
MDSAGKSTTLRLSEYISRGIEPEYKTLPWQEDVVFRIEAFLKDVLRAKGHPNSELREVVRIAITDCEQSFRKREMDNFRKDQAARRCRDLCRDRVVEEIRRRKGTSIAQHLKLVLSVIDEL